MYWVPTTFQRVIFGLGAVGCFLWALQQPDHGLEHKLPMVLFVGTTILGFLAGWPMARDDR